MEFDIESKIASFPFTQNNGLGIFISNLLGLLIGIAAVLLLVFLVWGGIEWILSGGEKAGVENARNKITNALIGLVIVVAAWAIFSLLKTFLGLPNNVQVGGGGGPGGGGGGTGGKSVCGGTVNCCYLIDSNHKDPAKCCKQIADMTSCVVGYCKNSQAECRADFRIDWKCWERNYPWPGGNSNDPCTPLSP